ncbi:MAG: ATP-binding cassette domain-containing protein, partial [Chromatiaceae bacterium]|nr:ATP-binding cassette domain-containing protein [Chromatiaceae bacterium]
MERIAPAHVDSPFHFAFRAPPSLPRPLLTLDEGRAGYGDKIILQKVRLSLEPGDRIGLLGPNGAGKSTLIKVLAGQLPLASGHQGQAQGLRIGYFAQHQMDQLRPDDSPLKHLQRLAPEATEQALRSYLGGFDFAGDKALEPVAPFSGGEKARLALALVIWGRPNLLLLDEPTNHLDLEMREALGEALQDFEGALVVVSHDRHLLRVTVDQLLLVDAGRVAPFDGDLDDYPTWLLRRQTRAEAAEGSGDGGGREETADPAATLAPETAAARKDQRRQEAEERKRLQPLRQRLKKLETRLDQLSARRTALETALAEPCLYDDEGKPRLLTLLADKQRLDAEQEDVESDWLIASEELEEALGG